MVVWRIMAWYVYAIVRRDVRCICQAAKGVKLEWCFRIGCETSLKGSLEGMGKSKVS